MTTPVPGVVIVVTLGSPGGVLERERAALAFRGRGVTPEQFQDGSLTVTYQAARDRELSTSNAIVCLLDGRLHDVPGSDPSQSPAVRLAMAYAERGEAVLPELRGEFWALLWDRSQDSGIVVADQIGSRGPYWTRDGETLVVASEIRDLLTCLKRAPSPDPVAVAHWLMSTPPNPGRTLLAGVESVPAGHLLRLSTIGGAPQRYWSPSYREPWAMGRDEQVARLRDCLEEAVIRRRAPDGETGILLSGGLDSTTVAALARRHGNLRAYSAVFPDHPEMDESALIDRTAKFLGMDSTRIVIRGGSTIRGALEYIGAWGVPPTSPNLFFWTPLLQRAAADGISVMLDGEGGDELFSFSPFLVADRLRRGQLRSAVGLARRWPGQSEPPSRALVWRRLRLAGAKALMPPAAHHLSRRIRGTAAYVPQWLAPALARSWLDTEPSSFAWKQLPGPRWWAFLVELVTRGAGPSVIYEQSRRRSRLAGVGASHPLVDVDVIELVLRLDPELNFDQRFGRSVLRDATTGLIPDEVRLRRGKSGFDALFHQLLAGPELPAVRRLLDPASALLGEYVDMQLLQEELLRGDPSAHTEGLSRWAIRVWRLVTAELWLRAREDPGAVEQLMSEAGLPEIRPEFEFA